MYQFQVMEILHELPPMLIPPIPAAEVDAAAAEAVMVPVLAIDIELVPMSIFMLAR